jgi:integral membrane protein (TIGR01906 family)
VRRAVSIAVVVAIAIATPVALVATGFRVLAHEWFVAYEYDRDGFPADRYGLTREQRQTLALVGLESIRPGSAGIVLLREAELPDGTPAFDRRELAHMNDVRGLFGAVLRFQLVFAVGIAVLALSLARTRWRLTVPGGLLGGALGTIAVAVAAVPLILVGFDRFFVGFHEVLFDGSSWRFSSTDTLLRLYPERFWEDTSRLVAVITVAQAMLFAPLAYWWLRRARRAMSR